MYLPGYNIKVIGKPIGGRDEPVIDGDLDNVCWEGKPNQGPCPPKEILPSVPVNKSRPKEWKESLDHYKQVWQRDDAFHRSVRVNNHVLGKPVKWNDDQDKEVTEKMMRSLLSALEDADPLDNGAVRVSYSNDVPYTTGDTVEIPMLAVLDALKYGRDNPYQKWRPGSVRVYIRKGAPAVEIHQAGELLTGGTFKVTEDMEIDGVRNVTLDWVGPSPASEKWLDAQQEANLSGKQLKVLGPRLGGDEPVVDGDLDNVCWENKPNEAPCPPDAIRGREGLEDVPLPPSEIFKPEPGAGRWGKQSQDRLNRRRQAATRKKFRRDSYGRNKPVKREEILKAIEDGEVSSPEFLKKIRDMLDFKLLGREQARSFVQGVSLVGGDKADDRTRLYDRPAILVWGKLYLPDGRAAGSFERVFFPEEGSVKHEYLQVDDRFKGSGIGGDFTAESEEIYPRAGFDKVKVTAALSEGPFVWAAKGFDWTDDKEREKFLDTIEIETMIQDQNLTDGDPVKYFDSKEEIDMVLELVDKARGQKFDDKERVRPIDFTFSKGVRNFLTDEEVEKRSWNGIKYL